MRDLAVLADFEDPVALSIRAATSIEACAVPVSPAALLPSLRLAAPDWSDGPALSGHWGGDLHPRRGAEWTRRRLLPSSEPSQRAMMALREYQGTLLGSYRPRTVRLAVETLRATAKQPGLECWHIGGIRCARSSHSPRVCWRVATPRRPRKPRRSARVSSVSCRKRGAIPVASQG